MQIDAITTTFIAVLVLFLGQYVTNRASFLKKYSIPIPVTAGLLMSILFTAGHYFAGIQIVFDMGVSTFLLLAFYATIGLSARAKLLWAGGKAIIILAVAAGIFLIVQNGIGVGVASLFGLDPLIGLLGGAISLSGGHGTALAYAPLFAEEYGIENAREIGAAMATAGLVIAGLIGGPIARRLIERNKLEAIHDEVSSKALEEANKAGPKSKSRHFTILKVIAVVLGCVVVGKFFNGYISRPGFVLPEFVSVLFVGVILVNFLDFTKWRINADALELTSRVTLDIFLVTALMSLNLIALSGLGIPLLVMLGAQVFFVLIWEYYFIFRAMGSNYDAAVIAAGDTGFTLGATPTAMANIARITNTHGASPKAFLAIPLVGAFLIDILNVVSTQGWLYFLT